MKSCIGFYDVPVHGNSYRTIPYLPRFHEAEGILSPGEAVLNLGMNKNVGHRVEFILHADLVELER